jgi:glycosyltransferase involved in cell wall biosynthesis
MPAEKKHIALICSRLDLPGGIERAIVNLANLFVEKGHAVTLVILDETKNSFYPLHPSIRIIQQPLFFGITEQGNLFSRKTDFIHDIIRLKRIIKALHADIIIATEYPFAIAAVFAGGRKYAKVISWEHHHFYELKKSFFWERSFRIAYPKLDSTVCLNEDEKKLFLAVGAKAIVIPNFTMPTDMRSSLKNKTILTVARIAYVKGTDLLLKTARLVFEKHPEWKWKLIGSGLVDNLANRVIAEEGIPKNLSIQKPVDHNIFSEYQNASMYVMTSRNECFPMTLLEAMSAGLPCIAFDCETGPRHIINHNIDGLLVENENPVKLAEAISSLISDEERRKKMGENAFLNVQRFLPEKIYALWENLFSSQVR